MKRHIMLLVLLAGVALFSSCGLDELADMAKNPVHARGEIDPNVGLPLASGQVRLDELLGMLGSSGMGMDEYINQDSNTITIMYDAEMNDSIEAGSLISGGMTSTRPTTGKPRVATKDMIPLQDTTIVYPLDISFFENVEMEAIRPGNIGIEHFWLKLTARIWGDCPDNVREKVSQYVRASIDDITIKYTSMNGTTETFHDPWLDNLDVHFEDNDILKGATVTTEEHPSLALDLARIIDSMPTKIELSLHISFSADESIFGNSISDLQSFPEMLDSIGLTKLYYTGNVHAEMPLSILIDSLPFSFPVSLPEGGVPNINAMLDSIYAGLDINIENSHLFLGLENHMPIDLGISARFKNDDGYLGGNIFSGKVVGAPVDALGIVNGTADTTLVATINTEVLENLSHATQLEVKIDIGTTRDANGNPLYVKIRRDDFLRIKLYSNLHLRASADITIKD